MNKVFWLVFKKGGDITVFIQSAGALGMARLRAAIAGVEGEFQKGHELDGKTARKIPNAMIGTPLTRKHATALLKRLD